MNTADRTGADLTLIDDTTFINPTPTFPFYPDYAGYFALLPTPKKSPEVGTYVVVDNIPAWHKGMTIASIYGSNGIVVLTTDGLYAYNTNLSGTPSSVTYFDPAWTPIEGLQYRIEFHVLDVNTLGVSIFQDGRLITSSSEVIPDFCTGAAVDGNLGRVFTNGELATVGPAFKLATGIRYLSMGAVV